MILALAGVACTSPSTDAADTGDGPNLRRTRSAIIHGTPSPPTQDSVVMLNLGQDGFCSGTLIAPNVVLTARHCVTNLAEDDCATFQGDIPFGTLGVAVGAGATENSPAVAHAKQYFYVDSAKDLCGPFDIAVVLLDRQLRTATSPVRAEPVTEGEKLLAVGYGEDENHALAGRRQRTDVSAVAIGPATKTFTPTDGAKAFTYQIPLGEIATSEAACHGDSGGPIFDSAGRVVGVTSRGADPNDICVARPDIYSAVAAHIDVIDKALNAAGFPRAQTPTTTKPTGTSAQTTDPSSDDSASDDGTDDPAPAKATKKKTSTAQPAASGCAISAGSSSSSSSSGLGALVVLGLALTAALRRRARKRSLS